MSDKLSYLYSNMYNLDKDDMYLLSLIIKNIINKDSELTEKEKKLLIKYAVMEKCLYYKYPVIPVQFVAEQAVPQDKKDAGGWYRNGVIYITQNTLNDAFLQNKSYPFYGEFTNEVERLLLVPDHECEHYFQAFDCQNNRFTLGAYYYVIYQITKLNEPEEYHKNYAYKQIENQANVRGWQDVSRFLAKHQYRKKSTIFPALQSAARSELSHQKSEKSDLIEYYNISSLIKHCYIQPNLIDKYPLLQEFFINCGNNKGLLKDTASLIENYNILPRRHVVSQEKQIIYQEFFNYLFNQDINRIDENAGLLVFDLIESDLISLQGVFDYKDSKPIERKKVIQEKIDRIIKYYGALSDLNLLGTPYDDNNTIEDTMTKHLKETLKVYETAKDMYNNFDEDTESFVNQLRERFNYYDVETRPQVGRMSAINI